MLINNVKAMNFLGLDLNCERRFCDPAKHDFAGMIDEPRPAGVRASDAASAADDVSPLRGRYAGERKVKSFSCLDQFLCMAFAQLTYRESLRDIEACLRAQRSKLYHLGIRATVARNTLANANAVRDWRIYADFAPEPDRHRATVVRRRALRCRLKETVYALDTTTIDLCLSVFPWAPFRSTKAAIKLHTLLDLRGNIPTFIHISDGKMHDVNILDQLLPEPGAFYIMDRGFLDFERLYRFHEAGSFFVTRGKVESQGPAPLLASGRPHHRTDLRSDRRAHRFLLAQGLRSAAATHPLQGPRDRQDAGLPDQQLRLAGAHDITELYRCRWQVELFFKWIKQHLRIKAFFGTSENAVKTQIWIAVSVYVLVAIVKKRLKLSASLYEILQILSLTMFERMPLDQLLAQAVTDDIGSISDKQLILFE